MGKHEEIYFIEASPGVVERIPMLIYADDIVGKVMAGSSEMKQKLGDSLIICIQFLVVERRRLMEQKSGMCKACNEEVATGEMGLCMHCENLMQQEEMNDGHTIVEDDDGYAD